MVDLTGLGGIKALKAGPWIESGGAGSRSGVTSAGTLVGGRGWVFSGMVVEEEELVVLLYIVEMPDWKSRRMS